MGFLKVRRLGFSRIFRSIKRLQDVDFLSNFYEIFKGFKEGVLMGFLRVRRLGVFSRIFRSI